MYFSITYSVLQYWLKAEQFTGVMLIDVLFTVNLRVLVYLEDKTTLKF